jgi:protein-S-isoprenylcysteine O-methyltransferase Ste14
MWVSFIVIVIYLSFVLDLWIWPIPSEASTASLLSSEGSLFTLKSAQALFGLLLSLIFYLAPLYLSIWALIRPEMDLTPIWLVVPGLFISLSGRVISLAGTSALRKNHGNTVVESSIYKRSRNPITTGMHLTVFGLLMCYNYWALWIGFPIYFLILHSKIKLEERFLKKKFGQVYSQYMEKTRRYL